MPSSVKPNQFRELIASLDGDFCEKFIGSLQAPALFAAWYKQTFNANGTLTDEFKAMVCGGVAGTGGNPTTPPVTPPVVTPPAPPATPTPTAPLAPVVLIASSGLPSGVRLNWTVSTGATHYQVLRMGQVIAIVTGTMHVDTVPAGRSYIYSVIAFNSVTGQTSAPSNEAYGYTGSPFGGIPPIL